MKRGSNISDQTRERERKPKGFEREREKASRQMLNGACKYREPRHKGCVKWNGVHRADRKRVVGSDKEERREEADVLGWFIVCC